MMSLAFQHPFTMIIAGPTMSGKSTFITRLLKNKDVMINPPPEKIYFCYSEWQQAYDNLENVDFHEGPIDLNTLDSSIPKLIIYDDLMDSINDELESLFVKHAHHRNLGVIFVTQNLFQKSKQYRTISLNASYLVIFSNPRDRSQILHLARQMYPSNSRYLLDAYQNATTPPHGYLLCDLKQQTDEKFRLRTNIFPDEITFVYIPAKPKK